MLRFNGNHKTLLDELRRIKSLMMNRARVWVVSLVDSQKWSLMKLNKITEKAYTAFWDPYSVGFHETSCAWGVLTSIVMGVPSFARRIQCVLLARASSKCNFHDSLQSPVVTSQLIKQQALNFQCTTCEVNLQGGPLEGPFNILGNNFHKKFKKKNPNKPGEPRSCPKDTGEQKISTGRWELGPVVCKGGLCWDILLLFCG